MFINHFFYYRNCKTQITDIHANLSHQANISDIIGIVNHTVDIIASDLNGNPDKEKINEIGSIVNKTIENIIASDQAILNIPAKGTIDKVSRIVNKTIENIIAKDQEILNHNTDKGNIDEVSRIVNNTIDKIIASEEVEELDQRILEICRSPESILRTNVLYDLWRVVYWSSQLLTWIILPLIQVRFKSKWQARE